MQVTIIYCAMDLKLELSKDSIQEIGKIVQETVREELRKLLSESSPKRTQENVLLNRKQACKLLRCSLTTLYHYQKGGKIPFHQVGRKVFFDKEELINHLKINTKTEL